MLVIVIMIIVVVVVVKYQPERLSLHRHYKSCGKSHRKERLRRKALRRPRKTDTEGADMTCCGRMFQVWAAATGKARSPSWVMMMMIMPRMTMVHAKTCDVLVEFGARKL